ncbi:MAG: hypothetical protein WA962_10640 [Ornithinimicrobium sp.]
MLQVLDLMGWFGGFLVAGGYIMVSLRRVAPDSVSFQMLNVVGAGALGISCIAAGSLPPACLNAIWFVFGARSLVLGGIRRSQGKRQGQSQDDFCSAA